MDRPADISSHGFLLVSLPPFLNDGSGRRHYFAGRSANSSWRGSLPGFLFLLYSGIVLPAGGAVQNLWEFLNCRTNGVGCIRGCLLRRHISARAKSMPAFERFDRCVYRVANVAAVSVHGAP